MKVVIHTCDNVLCSSFNVVDTQARERNADVHTETTGTPSDNLEGQIVLVSVVCAQAVLVSRTLLLNLIIHPLCFSDQ